MSNFFLEMIICTIETINCVIKLATAEPNACHLGINNKFNPILTTTAEPANKFNTLKSPFAVNKVPKT